MKAAVNSVYGPPSVLHIAEIDKPDVEADDILIKVAYAGVNRTDLGFLRAKPAVTRLFSGIFKPKYQSLGCEFSGIVESVGENVTEFKKGDKVFGFDDQKFGGYSEYKVMKAKGAVAKLPAGIDLKIAGAATEGAHYALFYIYKIKDIKNAKIFVNGATGAIGSAALQLLKERGAYIHASSTTKQLNMVKKLGADKVIDWQKEDITKLPKEFDVFFDSVGKSRFRDARKILKNGGVYMSSELGPWGQNPLLSIINPIQKLCTGYNIKFPIPQTRKEEIIEISRVLKSGAFKPLIDKEYALKDIRKAFEYVETGQKVGSVIVKI